MNVYVYVYVKCTYMSVFVCECVHIRVCVCMWVCVYEYVGVYISALRLLKVKIHNEMGIQTLHLHLGDGLFSFVKSSSFVVATCSIYHAGAN